MSDLRDELPILRAASAEESAQPAAPALSVGQLLQQARQARALSLQDLSDRLKVPVKRLEALEADQFESGPALQVGRAMVASVARQLGLDAQALLAKMPQAATVSIVPVPHEAQGSYRPSSKSSPRSASVQSMPRIWWLTGIFLVLSGFVFLMPYAEQWWASLRPAPATVELAVQAAASAPVAAPAAPPPMQEASTAAVAQPASVAAHASAAASAAPARQASAPAALPASAPAALPLIAFKAHGPTWVEVIDANGQILLRRTLTNAETVQTSGALPLSVVVGRADHTEVTVRSIPYPLDAVTTENVARFKVQ